jgi:hypothetical protein
MADQKEMEGHKANLIVRSADTGEAVTQADMGKLVRNEEWAKGLIDPGTYEFAITSDALLLLCDECGQYRCVPEGLLCWHFETEDGTVEGT